MNTEQTLVQYIMEMKYEHFPSEVIHSTKKHIMDTLGVAIAGSKYSVSSTIVNQVKQWAGSEESTILVYGGRVPCQNAAMANGAMARALDLGGVYEKGATHPNETVIPAALALGEREKTSGEDLITAVTIGIDLICRLKLVTRKFRGFVGESIFGASAAASKILKLDEGETLNALNIAFCLAAGTYQMVIDNNSFMHVSHGMRAYSGILSALFAQQGVTGPKSFIEGEYGLYNVYENREDCEIEELTRELGERFESVNVSIKPYPACRFAHSAIYGTLELFKENQIQPQDISKITVGVNEMAYKLNCIPEEKKISPKAPIEVQFSIPFLIGTSVIKKDVFIEHITDESMLRNEDILHIARRVKCYIDNELEQEFVTKGSMGAIIKINTKEGKIFEKRISNAFGHPENPLSFDQVVKKFRKCSLYGARLLPQRNIDQAIEMLSNLQQVGDISTLSNLFT